MADAKGVLPKNVQTWAMLSITALVVGVLVFSMFQGTPKPKGAVGASPSPSPTPTTEQEQRLKQLEADQARLVEQALLLQQQANQMPQYQAPMPEPTPDDIAKAKVQREYTSLFAGQLARSERTSAPTAVAAPAPVQLASTASGPATNVETRPGQPTPTAIDRNADLDAQLATLEAQQAALAQGVTQPLAAAAGEPKVRRQPTTGRNAVQPGAPTYFLTEGTIIETALVNRLNSDFSGPVSVQVATPVYTRNRSALIIPSGSRILGEASKVSATGQTRLAVAFHRLVMPDGYSVDLDQFTGLSSRGETALKDKVNNHYFQIFGSSIALGLLGGLSALGTSPSTSLDPRSSLDEYRLGVASSFSQSATRVLERFLNIPPTITIREGHRVRVWITQDLTLPAYDKHAMPADL